MRAYLLDEIAVHDMSKVKTFLDTHAMPSRVDEIYWVQLPDDLLSPLQASHQDCRPHVFAVELGTDWLKFEFLIRSLQTFRCNCPAYCTDPQRRFILQFADGMMTSLGIQT